MKKIFVIAFLGLTKFCYAGQIIDREQLTEVLSCVNSQESYLGIKIPRIKSGKIKMKYYSGKFLINYPDESSKMIGRDNEMWAIVYTEKNDMVVIYDIFLVRDTKEKKIELGYPAIMQKIKGKWNQGDNPGGIPEIFFRNELMKKVSNENFIILPSISDNIPKKNNCSYIFAR